MATSTANAGLSYVADFDFVGKFERDVSKLRDLLAASDWRRMRPGQVLYAHAISGTFEAAQTTPGAAVTPSVYSDTGTPIALTFNRWSTLTPVEDVAAYGRDEAILRKDDALLKDIQKDVVGQFMAGISTTATGTASGTGFQDAAASAWAALGTACDNERCTPVFFANFVEAGKYLSAANISVQQAFGLTYVANFLGIGTLILDVNVPNGKLWATAAENIIVATADLETVRDFDMYMAEDGVIAVSHKEAMDNGAIATHAWAGITVLPMFDDRVIISTIN